jgi:hypothetical protein
LAARRVDNYHYFSSSYGVSRHTAHGAKNTQEKVKLVTYTVILLDEIGNSFH